MICTVSGGKLNPLLTHSTLKACERFREISIAIGFTEMSNWAHLVT